MKFKRHTKLEHGLQQIDIAPLVDVIFQLLIFFMLSSGERNLRSKSSLLSMGYLLFAFLSAAINESGALVKVAMSAVETISR